MQIDLLKKDKYFLCAALSTTQNGTFFPFVTINVFVETFSINLKKVHGPENKFRFLLVIHHNLFTFHYFSTPTPFALPDMLQSSKRKLAGLYFSADTHSVHEIQFFSE